MREMCRRVGWRDDPRDDGQVSSHRSAPARAAMRPKSESRSRSGRAVCRRHWVVGIAKNAYSWARSFRDENGNADAEAASATDLVEGIRATAGPEGLKHLQREHATSKP